MFKRPSANAADLEASDFEKWGPPESRPRKTPACTPDGARSLADVFAVTRVQPYQPPKPAPTFALPGLDGKVTRLGDLRGKVVLVFFWGPRDWSGPAARAFIQALLDGSSSAAGATAFASRRVRTS